MSNQTFKTSRTKSGITPPSSSVHLSQGASKLHSSRNDPALLINQIQLKSNLTDEFIENKLLLQEKEFQVREKKLCDRLCSLEKVIEQLKKTLNEKSALCQKLELNIQTQKNELGKKLSLSREKCHSMQMNLDRIQVIADQKEVLLHETIQDYENKITELSEKYEAKVVELQKSKEEEIQDCNNRLEVLKKRMAANLGKNSQERQLQLEELKRDLVSQAHEARELQQRLKQFQLRPCENCHKLQVTLEEKTLQLRLKEKSLIDLQNIGKEMQTQLNQQDLLIHNLEKKYNDDQ